MYCNDYYMRQLSLNERVVLHNICTTRYTRFVTNLMNLLLPDDLQTDNRTDSTTINTSSFSLPSSSSSSSKRSSSSHANSDPNNKSVTQKFIEYYSSLVIASPSKAFGSYERLVANVARRLSPPPSCGNNDDGNEAGGYNRSIDVSSERLLNGIKVNPKTFRYLVRPRAFRIYERPIDLRHTGSRRFVIQPLLRGFFTVISCLGAETRCYNRYGDLLQSFLYDARFDVSATFEAIVLPLDGQGRAHNWRYWPFRKGYIVYVTDVFRYEQTVLTRLTFRERSAYIERIRGQCVRDFQPVDGNFDHPRRHRSSRRSVTNNGENDDIYYQPYDYWTMCENAYYRRSRDMFDSIGGVMIRCLNDTVVDPPLEYRFNLKSYYDFTTDQSYTLYGDVCVKECFSIAFDLEMSYRRNVRMIYAHDDRFMYACRFDRETTFQFVHVESLPRFQNLQSTFKQPHYRSEPLYILDPVIPPMGVAFVRVYTDRFGAVIGYEQKSTNGMYDVEIDLYKNKDDNATM